MSNYIKWPDVLQVLKIYSRDEFENKIEAIPAADVRENVHAHWINTDQCHVRCSNYKYEYHDSIIGVALFCPHCDAIIDGGDEP